MHARAERHRLLGTVAKTPAVKGEQVGVKWGVLPLNPRARTEVGVSQLL